MAFSSSERRIASREAAFVEQAVPYIRAIYCVFTIECLLNRDFYLRLHWLSNNDVTMYVVNLFSSVNRPLDS